MKIYFLVTLATFSFSLHAKDINSIKAISNKNRIEKLERGVAELGAERERARATKYKTGNKTKTIPETNYPINTTSRVISNKERLKKLEQGVTELGAERERARVQNKMYNK